MLTRRAATGRREPGVRAAAGAGGRLLGVAATALLVLAIGSVGSAAASRREAPGADCPPGQGNCNVWDGKPGTPGNPGKPDGGGPGGGGGGRTCQRDGQPMPCYDDLLGWFNNADGCYYKLQEPQPEGTPEGKQWYLRSCNGAQDSQLLDAAPDGFAAPPDPAELAQQALASINLAPPTVHLAPNKGPGLVGLPVWMWTDPYEEPTASASAPGLTVTIEAKVRQIVWDMGNGTRIPCPGPGTRYDAEAHRGVASPDCGYDSGYPRSSRTEPGGVYRVTATTTWQVTWTGGGESGVLPPQLRTSANPGAIRIDELQVVTQ